MNVTLEQAYAEACKALGEATVTSGSSVERLLPGEALFVPASAGEVAVTGMGTVYRATPGP